jgi:hypothetical protein
MSSIPLAVHPASVPAWADTWAGGDIAAYGDTVIAVYSTGQQGVGTLYASRSVDGGISWPDTVSLAPLSGMEARFPTVGYVPGKGPVVQYMEFDPNWLDPRYVVVNSQDGGSTYSAPVPISAPFAPGEPCDCCTGQIVAEVEDVVGLFRNNDNNLRTIWGASSMDGGDSFGAGEELDQTGWVINSCPSSGPDGYIVDDSIRYVWMSSASNGTKTYFGTARLSDLSIGVNALVHGGQPQNLSQNFPRIAGVGDTLGIVWEQFSSGQREILFSWSASGWSGLSAPDTVNVDLSGQQRVPDIAFNNGIFHIVWQDDATSTIRYRTASIDPDAAIAESPSVETMACWPVPAREVLHISVPPRSTYLQVLDAKGLVVLRDDAVSMLNVSGLAAGWYSLYALGANGKVLGRAEFVKR